MKQYTMILALLAMTVGAESNQNLKDARGSAIIYITNSSDIDLYLTSGNPVNNGGYSGFNCFYPLPQERQIVPSPSFKTIILDGYYVQSALIKAGKSVMYAFSSKCDSNENPNTRESFALNHATEMQKLSVMFINMYIDKKINELSYTKQYTGGYTVYGNIVAPNWGIKPWSLTVLVQ